MIVARHFAAGKTELRLVPEGERTFRDLLRDLAPALRGRRGIVIAGNPDELREPRQALDLRSLYFRQTLDRAAIMKRTGVKSLPALARLAVAAMK